MYEALRPILNEMNQRIDNGLDSIRDDLMKVNQNLTEEVYEALRPILNEMREDIISEMKSDIMVMKNEIATISQSVSNQTEEINTRLSALNESMRDDFSSTENMICDKIEEHNNQITTELMRMNQTQTKELINNRESIYDTAGLKCGGTWGWRRAVYLDMTDNNTNCPSGWQLTGYSNSKRSCGRASRSSLSCDSVFFPVSGGPYSQVCGRIRAYQYGVPDAFLGYNIGGQTTIDSAYVSGVTVMYGSPRQHIWTFANGARENQIPLDPSNCPCDLSVIHLSHHLLEKITSVSLGMYLVVAYHTHSTPMTFSGMRETVTPPVHVVLSTILHISPKPSTRQLLMTWN